MTKTELIATVANKTGLPKAAAEKAVKATIEGIAGALAKGDKVTLVGFGTFEVTKRAARNGVNPRTRKPIKIKASKGLRFRAGKALKDTVNK
ncbi:MAG: HU family DNA-binding protein [Deltaproteobacteria bacterium]|nr:HU family DNA-binding protein [Deltaproteobacteria bacterium]